MSSFRSPAFTIRTNKIGLAATLSSLSFTRRGKYVVYVLLCLFLCSGVLPEAQGQEMNRMLETIRERHALPALAAAVIVNGQITDTAATGVRKFGETIRVTANDQFHMGSCTKSMTATLIGRLVERGKLRWKSTIADVFPELADSMRPEYKAVTLEMLLSHRGGFPARSYPLTKSWNEIHALPGTPREQRYAYIKLFLADPPEAAPGEKYIYSNPGYAIAGAMAERVMDTPWEALMQKLIFEPLHMTTAGFGPMGKPGPIEQPWQHLAPLKKGGNPNPVEPKAENDNPDAIGPAGKVHCSLSDWARYILVHLRGERGEKTLLKPETIQKLHEPLFGGD